MQKKDALGDTERLREMLLAAQMIGFGLAQLLMNAYKRIDELEAEVLKLSATNDKGK